jgi:ubiquinone/menaquinone biosynthesis C-methylase UbiE
MPPEPDPRPFLEVNRQTWDGWTKLHVGSAMYDTPGFLAGRCTLDRLELAGLGDVKGQSLLHLQCHFGQSTLSWARLGARVTGIDFSEEAIRTARELAGKTGLDARFIQSNLYDLPRVLQEEFDVVFTSYGVLPWLPDLEEWGRIIYRYLKPGGRFFIVEQHPTAMILDDRPGSDPLHVHYPYFRQSEPERFTQKGSYAAPEADFDSVTFEWFHSMADILGAILRAGLRITSFEEYPFACYRALPSMEEGADGFWRLPAGSPDLPFTFALGAVKEEAR